MDTEKIFKEMLFKGISPDNEFLSSLISTLPFEPEPACPDCKDMGWLFREEDGYRSSRRCRCLIAKQATQRINNSGLEHIMVNWTFDSYTVSNALQQRMKDTALKFVADVSAGGKPWLFMGGAVGSGKSHLCTAACGELLRDRFSVRYFQWLTDARQLKSVITDSDDYDDILNRFNRADIMYIDDLFKSKRNDGAGLNPSDADVRLAFELINGRYVQDKIVVISSEWMLTELMDIDEGTFSRVFEKCKAHKVEIKREKGRNYRTAEQD